MHENCPVANTAGTVNKAGKAEDLYSKVSNSV